MQRVVLAVLVASLFAGCASEDEAVDPVVVFADLGTEGTIEVDGVLFRLSSPAQEVDAWGIERPMFAVSADDRVLWIDLDRRSTGIMTYDSGRAGPPESICGSGPSPLWVFLLAGREWSPDQEYRQRIGSEWFNVTLDQMDPLTVRVTNGDGVAARVSYTLSGNLVLEDLQNVTVEVTKGPEDCQGETFHHHLRVLTGRGRTISFTEGVDESVVAHEAPLWPPRLNGTRFQFPIEEAVDALAENEEYRRYAQGEIWVDSMVYENRGCGETKTFAHRWSIFLLRDDGEIFQACVHKATFTSVEHTLVRKAEQTGATDRSIPPIPSVQVGDVLRIATAHHADDSASVQGLIWRQPQVETLQTIHNARINFGSGMDHWCQVDIMQGVLDRCRFG